jgi:hypothetical protein
MFFFFFQYINDDVDNENDDDFVHDDDANFLLRITDQGIRMSRHDSDDNFDDDENDAVHFLS